VNGDGTINGTLSMTVGGGAVTAVEIPGGPG
jgi:hypothetical protein